jgi:DNA-binding CsgD family transcriptional regulator
MIVIEEPTEDQWMVILESVAAYIQQQANKYPYSCREDFTQLAMIRVVMSVRKAPTIDWIRNYAMNAVGYAHSDMHRMFKGPSTVCIDEIAELQSSEPNYTEDDQDNIELFKSLAVSKRERYIIDKLLAGASQVSIAKELGVSKQSIGASIALLRNKYNKLTGEKT